MTPDTEHAPLLVRRRVGQHQVLLLIGCACGWRVPEGATDPDNALAAHAALALLAASDEGDGDDEHGDDEDGRPPGSESTGGIFPMRMIAVVRDADRQAARDSLGLVLSSINGQLAEQRVPVRFQISAGPRSGPEAGHMYDSRQGHPLCGSTDDQATAARIDLTDAGVYQLDCAECLSRLITREEATLVLLRERMGEIAS